MIEPTRTRLDELEAVIDAGIQTFVDVGQALIEIRDSRLYRAEYATFEDYCQKRWGWSRGHAYNVMDSAQVVGLLSSGDDIPATEYEARQLVPLKDEPHILRSVWAGVIERAEATKSKVTAPMIRTAVRDHIRGMAALAEQEMRDATAWMSPEQRDAVSPEMLRQRGELRRLIGDLNRLPEATQYARLHGDGLGDQFIADAMYACGWLETFCDGLEGKDARREN